VVHQFATGVESAPGWNLEPALLVEAALVAAAYALRVRTLRRRGRAVPAWRQLCFYAGVAVLLAALVSPVDTIGESRLFYVHMVQHLMIGDVAPLLILLGLSGPILRPVLAALPTRRLRWLANPLVALPLWTAIFFGWHLPALYEAAIGSEAVHALEHVSFSCAGMLMWAAVFEPIPGPAWFGSGAKAAYVLVVRALGAILANVFIWFGSPLYPTYAGGEAAAGVAPLTDQQIGGAIMLVEGGFVTVVVFAWLFLRWSADAELRQSLLDSGVSSREAGRAARFRRRAPAAPR
jgi:putative membrane protein